MQNSNQDLILIQNSHDVDEGNAFLKVQKN